MSKHRVVVTGLGAVTPIGLDTNEFWNGLISGKNGVAPITHFDASKFDTKFAAEVKNFSHDIYFDNPICHLRLGQYIYRVVARAAAAVPAEDKKLTLRVATFRFLLKV